MDYDFLFKVLIIGQTGVGKTALLNRYVDDEFYERTFSTIGVDYKLKSLEVLIKEVPKQVKLQLWDTAGQERFHAITTSYFRGAHGVMLVFALNDLLSFERLQYWMDIVDDQHVEYKILIGNKSDIVPRTVTSEMISNFCKGHSGLKYMETSAKTGNCVEETFKEMASTLAEKMNDFRVMNEGKMPLPKIVKAQKDEEEEEGGKTRCCGGTG